MLQLEAAQPKHPNKRSEELWGSSEEKTTNPELKEHPEHLKGIFLS